VTIGIRTLSAKARTAVRLGPRRQLLVMEAALTMLAARIALAIVPFGRLSRRFGRFVSPADAGLDLDPGLRGMATPRETLAVRRVGWAVRTVSPNLPFRAVCLQQAIAAQAMLRRRGVASVMHFGIDAEGQALPQSHAWLSAAGIGVTGFPIGPNLVELGRFV